MVVHARVEQLHRKNIACLQEQILEALLKNTALCKSWATSQREHTLFIWKDCFFRKNHNCSYKKCVAPQRPTFLWKNNYSFFVPLRATSWLNFSIIGPVVEKPIRNQFFWENSIFSKKCPFSSKTLKIFRIFPFSPKFLPNFINPIGLADLIKFGVNLVTNHNIMTV